MRVAQGRSAEQLVGIEASQWRWRTSVAHTSRWRHQQVHTSGARNSRLDVPQWHLSDNLVIPVWHVSWHI